ncbi:MAG: hypothetical protein MUP11_10880, partial [Anaerolineales bacterium]|nr:hypothetical protein [Anaerolineales bacterium]
HFKHSIPAGYLETLSSGKNEIHDPDIAAYYGILRFIVRGDLFNPERLSEVLNLTLGKYDYLLK